MKNSKKKDIFLNIITPLFLGVFIYQLKTIINIPALIKDHFADGLWAYAFISSILIIWDRKINTRWILTTFIFAFCFELLQYFHTIPGTGDVYDVITYFIFFTGALMFNHFFKTKFPAKTLNNAKR